MGILKYSRKSPLEGVGTTIVEDKDLNQIMEEAGLKYTVEKVQNFDPEGDPVDSWSTRWIDADGRKHYLGNGLSKQYTVLQNYEAFDFINGLLGDVKIENAGTIDDGRRSFICASTEPIKIMDDEIKPYLVFQNSFDRSTGVNIILTPIRVWCSNCMSLAIKQAANKLTIKHRTTIHDNLWVAHKVLLKNTEYLNAVKDEMEELATMHFNRRQFVDGLVVAILKMMGLYDEDGNPIDKKRNSGLAESYREAMLAAWSANDLSNYKDTAFAGIQAIMDFESHRAPLKNADNPEMMFKRILKGMVLSDFALQYVKNNSTGKIIY